MAETAATSTPDALQTGGAANRPARMPGASIKRSELVSDAGKTSIADTVVAKIAGLATREVSGVHDMGAGMARTFGAIKEKLPIGSNDPSPTRGVSVEVGERQAAVDLDGELHPGLRRR